MKTVYVKPTDTCNLDCDHCFTSGSKGAKTAWDIPVTTDWLTDLIKKYNDEHIHIELHGGEPFLRPIEEHWYFAKSLQEKVGETLWENVTIGGTTNLIYKLTETHERFITEMMGGLIATSWDPVYRFKNNRMLNLWLDNIKRLAELGVGMKLFVTATDRLMEYDPQELLRLWSTFNVTAIAVERLTSDGNAVDNPHLFPDNRVVDRFYYNLYRAYKSADWPFIITTFEAIDRKFETNDYKVDTNCRTCEQNLFTIDGAGNIGGCANGAKAESNGTINEDLDEFLISDGRLDRITKELDHNPSCLSCHLFDVCGGDCHRLVWQGNSCPGLTEILSYLKYGTAKTIPVTIVE